MRAAVVDDQRVAIDQIIGFGLRQAVAARSKVDAAVLGFGDDQFAINWDPAFILYRRRKPSAVAVLRMRCHRKTESRWRDIKAFAEGDTAIVRDENAAVRYADGPEAPPAWKDSPRIMHGQLTLYDGTLMASDYPPGSEGSPQQGISVMQTAPNLAEAQRVFSALAAQGAVIQLFQPTFFSPGFGMVKDKFGTHWIISALPATA